MLNTLHARSLLTWTLFTLLGSSLAFGQADVRKLKRSVKEAFGKGDRSAVRDLIDEIGDADSADAVDALTDLASDLPVPLVYDRVQRALRRLGSSEALEHWEKVLGGGKGDYECRVVLAEASRQRSDAQTGRALAEAVGDRNTVVAQVAAECAGARKLVEAVDSLIAVFAKLDTDREREGLLMDTVRKALLSITGEQFLSAKEWESFWAAKGEGFTPPSSRARRTLTPVTTRTRPKFFGSEIGYKRVVFVIDTSGSMRHDHPPRMERVKEQLAALVGSLPEDCQFMIITYSGCEGAGFPADAPRSGPLPPTLGGQTWLRQSGKKLQRATKSTKKAVRRFAATLQPMGRTYTLSAMQRAIAVKGAEAIVLLSDGQPEEPNRETGQLYSQREILSLIATLNRFERRRIDCFGLGGSGDSFLEALAEQEGGSFTSID